MRAQPKTLPILAALAVLLVMVIVLRNTSPDARPSATKPDEATPSGVAKTLPDPAPGKAAPVSPTGRFSPQNRREPEVTNYVRPRDPLPLTTEGAIAPFDAPEADDPEAAALGYLRDLAGKDGFVPEDFAETLTTDRTQSRHNGVTHLYFRQRHRGLEVYNADANANVSKNGQLLSIHQRFVPNLAAEVNRLDPVITADAAVRSAAKALGEQSGGALPVRETPGGVAKAVVFEGGEISQDPIPVKLMLLPQPGARTRLVWNAVLHLPTGSRWLDVNVDAETGALLSQVNWYASADYRVYPLPLETPLDGSRSLVTNPQNALASPFGWHDTNGAAGAEFFDTRGNNVNAQDDIDNNNTGGSRPSGGASLVFDNPIDLGQAPSTYLNGAITNLFYWNNILHDIHYQYGFDEASGNFQVNNYGKGGTGNDAVEADAQDGSGTNNANFATPPDGSRPRMQMFVWTSTTPSRDSDLDNVIIIHEYGHGVSNRLTGGPANSSALSANQSRGMGEGWSDWWGLALTAKPGQTPTQPRSVGYYVLGQTPAGNGIRPRPYTTNFGVNDYTYGDIVSGLSVPHGIGFVWCTILWEVYWELVAAHGYDPDVYTGDGGNNLALQLVMDGLKLQPATPTYLEARDAIILADQINNGGANRLLLWTAFARRGMGFSASDSGDPNNLAVTEAFDLPDEFFSVSDVSVTEGAAGPQTATFTVSLNPVATEQTQISYATANGTATAGADYTSTSGTLTFAAGETSKTVQVTYFGDAVPEEDETFHLVLSNPVNARIARSQGTATILNEDYIPPVINSPLTTTAAVGLPLTYRIQAANTPRSFALTGTLPSGMTVNGATGVISWTPVATGTVNVGIRATNPAGSDEETLAITVEFGGLNQALDTTALLTSSTPEWFAQTTTTHDGIDAAQSADINDNGTTYFQTTVTGPDTVRFWWKVSSELGWDFLRFTDNGASIRAISGDVDWQQIVYQVPAGTHVLRWTYSKDSIISALQDTAWVDELSFESTDPRPHLTSTTTIAVPLGQSFTHQITTSKPATAFAISQLPPGLSLNPTSGAITGIATALGTTSATLTTTNGGGSVVTPVKFQVVQYATAPYVNGFESVFGPETLVSGTGQSRAVITTANGPRTGLRHLVMDDTLGDDVYSRNEFTVFLNLNGVASPYLTFSAKSFGDEQHAPPSTTFLNGADFDGVAISSDGQTWHEIQALRSQLSTVWTTYTVDLGAVITARGLDRSRIQLRFNQFDNFPVSSDGIAFDDINVFEALSGVSAPDLSSATDSGDSDSDDITKFNTPTFTGSTLHPGSSISVYSSIQGLLGTGVANASGNWTVVTTVPMANGSHLVYAKRPLAGDGPTLAVTIDSRPPPVPFNVLLDPESDRGHSDSDGKTNDTTPTYSGDAEPGSVVEVLVDNVLHSSVPGDFGWKATVGPLTDGARQVRLRGRDLAGNVSQLSSAFALQIDTQSPNRPINVRLMPQSDLGSSNSDGITSDNTPDIGGSTGVASTIELFADGIFAGSAFVPAGNWTITSAPLPDGPRQIAARAVDEAGNASALSQSVNVVIDTGAPPPPVIGGLQAGHDTGASSSDGHTREQQPTLVGTSDPGTIRIFRDGTDLGTVQSNGSWSFATSAPLPEGSYVFTAQSAGDVAGNAGGLSAPFTVVIDRTPPAPPSRPRLEVGSDRGPSSQDGVTNDDTPEIGGTAEDGVIVTLYSAGSPVGSSSASGGAWKVEVGPLIDGTHPFTARTEDRAGNPGGESPVGQFTLDTVSPQVTLEQAPGQADPALTEPIEFEAIFTEPAYGLSSGGVDLSGAAGSGANAAIVGNPGATTYRVRVTGTSGEGDVIASLLPGAATDLAGNSSEASTSTDHTVVRRRVPGPVTGVSASDDAHPDRVAVTWQSDAGATHGYRIFRNRFPRAGDAGEVAQVTVGVEDWEDADVEPGVRYFYWVRGVDEDGIGEFGSSDPGRAALAGHNNRVETPLTQSGLPAATPGAWTNASSGIYDGLLIDSADGQRLVGHTFAVVTPPRAGVATGGVTSGTVTLKGVVGALRGIMDTAGRLVGATVQRDGSSLAFDLQLSRSHGAGSETLRGTITWQGLTALVDLPRSPYNARTNPVPAAKAGTHTLVMPALPGWGTDEPGGDGWALVNIATSGIVTVSGLLGDGTPFAEAAYLSGEAEPSFALFSALYRSVPKRGHIGGRVTLRDLPESDFDGVMQWTKLPDPTREIRYPAGFDFEVWALGSRYTPPAVGQRVLSQLANQEYNAALSLTGPTAPAGGQLDRVISWKATNLLIHYGPEVLTGSAAARTGQVAGNYVDPVTRVPVAFTGVAFQKQGLAAGVFVRGASSGALRILPGTGFSYPGSEAAGALTRVALPDPAAADPVENPAALVPAAAGLYGGVLTDGTGRAFGALEAVSLTAAGGVSGLVWVDGTRYGFRGVLGTNPIVIPRGTALPALHLTLQLSLIDGTATGYGLTGQIRVAGAPADLGTVDAQRLPTYHRLAHAPQTGLYTVAMRAPDGIDPLVEPGGDASGLLSVSYFGTCTGLVTLPDGTKVSLGGHVGTPYGGGGLTEWSFHRGLYGKVPLGYLAGKLTFRDSPGLADVDGEWRWVKRPGAVPLAGYAGGIDTVRGVVGSRYVAPALGTRAMTGLADDWWNLWLRLAGPDLSPQPAHTITALDRAATWTAANRIIYHGPEIFAVTFDPRYGLVTGVYFDATRGVNVRFEGVLLQDQGLVTGAYRAPGPGGPVSPVSGLFLAEPR